MKRSTAVIALLVTAVFLAAVALTLIFQTRPSEQAVAPLPYTAPYADPTLTPLTGWCRNEAECDRTR